VGRNRHEPKFSLSSSIFSYCDICKGPSKPGPNEETQKVAKENKTSGITPDEPSEFELGMDEICEKAEAAERDQQVISEERKASLEKEKKQAEDMRAKALEKVGDTKKEWQLVIMVVESLKKKRKEKRARSGTETIACLKEKSAKEFQIRQEELQIRKKEQCTQAQR